MASLEQVANENDNRSSGAIDSNAVNVVGSTSIDDGAIAKAIEAAGGPKITQADLDNMTS